MTLDLPTLLVVIPLMSAVLAGCLLAVGSPVCLFCVGPKAGRVVPGMRLWAFGLLAHALSFPAFELRIYGWSATSIVLTNTLTSTIVAFHTLAIVRYQRERVASLSERWLLLPIPLATLLALVFVEAHFLRNVTMGFLVLIQALLMLWVALAPGLKEPRERGRILLTVGALTLVVIFLLRLVMLFRAAPADWQQALSVPVKAQVVSYITTLATFVLTTMGYVLMRQERLLTLEERRSTHDPLTGASNRQALVDAMAQAVALGARQQLPLATLMLDIDHFKAINDTYGHLAGDAVLRELVVRLQGRLRQQDLLARYGGEEFVVLLPATDADGATHVAEELRRSVCEFPFTVRGQSIPVAVSIGVHVRVPGSGTDVTAQMLQVADQAMYQAKHKGRNRVEVL